MYTALFNYSNTLVHRNNTILCQGFLRYHFISIFYAIAALLLTTLYTKQYSYLSLVIHFSSIDMSFKNLFKNLYIHELVLGNNFSY